MKLKETNSADSHTPMMRQYLEIKKSYKNYILLFRLGDFYEMFLEDAVRASGILNIALTSRDGGAGKKVPMCGIPYHAAENYIEKLLASGERAAICEQVEDPKLTKGIVKREVTRIITPGTNLSDSQSRISQFLCSVYPFSDRFGLSVMDLTTGYFSCMEFDESGDLLSELVKIQPVECLLPEDNSNTKNLTSMLKGEFPQLMITLLEDWKFDYEGCYKSLIEHFELDNLDSFGLGNMSVGIVSSGVVLGYVKDALGHDIKHIRNLIPMQTQDYLIIDSASNQKLDLTSTHNGKKNSLFWVLDHTVTAAGARLLIEWINHPLLQVDLIDMRLDAISDIHEKKLIHDLQPILKNIRDIEKILSRVYCDYANARDLVSLKSSLEKIPSIEKAMPKDISSRLLDIAQNCDPLNELQDFIRSHIVHDAPISTKEGNMICEGVHEELDQLRELRREGKDWILKFKSNEIERTGIKGLKVGYNKVFGYYIEVTHTHKDKIPSEYIRKQTLVNAERYITDELKEYEAKILGANERIKIIEHEIFVSVREGVKKYTSSLQKTSALLAELDVYLSLSIVAQNNRYVRPVVDYSDQIEIKDGRHPVIEKIHFQERFIANDTLIDCEENQILIITGPNMAGKSTYIRQVALITIMAQIGSYVPCESAHLGVVDRIFTRIGASDDLSQGKSTFMVEMNETAEILKNATARSLIILDEIGRGTSTFDGISIAWSVVEYLHHHVECKAKTLFATHYHELTDLELTLPGVKNYNVVVKEWNDDIVFLRKIVHGNADKSYGIHVARLAGLPKEVVERAKEVLACLEDSYVSDAPVSKVASTSNSFHDGQMSLFNQPKEVIKDEYKDKILSLSLDELTPKEALNLLYQLKNEAKNK